VLEPSGAAALAALLAGRIERGGPLGLVLSGANVDPDLFARVIRGEL
jgi:threonine dehydratase